jgi:hypothetical protein
MMDVISNPILEPGKRDITAINTGGKKDKTGIDWKMSRRGISIFSRFFLYAAA